VQPIETEEAAMLYFTRTRFFRFVVPLTLVAFLPACYKYVEVETNVDSPTKLSSPTRVTLTDGLQLVLRDATVTADSLFGSSQGQAIRVSLEDTQSVEHQKTNWLFMGPVAVGLSIGLFYGVVALAFAS
jgi:hypothetical protein